MKVASNKASLYKRKFFILILSFIVCKCEAQVSDTLNGYAHKVNGEEITYFSPLHQFATTALLTRANGHMSIAWEAPMYKGMRKMVTYELLIGHSTGTSSGDRKFDVSLNGKQLFTMTTLMKKKDHYLLSGKGELNTEFKFIQQEFDINGDAFGKLYISIPASLAHKKNILSINGENEDSRDWLMVFMYHKGLKILAEPTNLITRKENKRQLNLYIDNPYPDSTFILIKTKHSVFEKKLVNGYNKLSVAAYAKELTGIDTIRFIVNHSDTLYKTVELRPVKNYVLHIIHHSHNDIGYSNLQTDVEKIQNKNIRDAMSWIKNNSASIQKPIWHIESLWAVENFLQTATLEETLQFVKSVHEGQLVLSANYANILTGLCQPEELNWMLEYANKLKQQYSFPIQNAMITDIPGISYSGLLAYVNNNISYLSLGPNYVANLPDKGDRIGSVIKAQGDKIFYWKPDSFSQKKLLVWTAGKGYSLFHTITENEKQQGWEQRISQYCNELQQTKYPYDIVQLRYTKNSDNGPVDTTLNSFVEHWNEQYIIPQLKISSVNILFKEFETKYGKDIPICTGEISPYWEDGAYSTAVEEMGTRALVLKTIALEKFAKAKKLYEANEHLFYRLHRDIIMFHEHTWGSWCSISDPEIPFTTEQWTIKKQFLDSAIYYYNQLTSMLSFEYQAGKIKTSSFQKNITDIEVDALHGGLKKIMVDGKNIVSQKADYNFFEVVYSLGINPSQLIRTRDVKTTVIENSTARKIIQVSATIPSMKDLSVLYTLHKKEGTLSCACSFTKQNEKNKESLHMAMPFVFNHPEIFYGTENHMLHYSHDQLPGSNKEFVCVEEKLDVQSENLTASIHCPKLAMIETGSMIDENKTNGVKVWKTSNNNTSNLFLYVLNNYWHTNFKAYQEGKIEFEIELSFASSLENIIKK